MIASLASYLTLSRFVGTTQSPKNSKCVFSKTTPFQVASNYKHTFGCCKFTNAQKVLQTKLANYKASFGAAWRKTIPCLLGTPCNTPWRTNQHTSW
jgi:hypothetical protein